MSQEFNCLMIEYKGVETPYVNENVVLVKVAITLACFRIFHVIVIAPGLREPVGDQT